MVCGAAPAAAPGPGRGPDRDMSMEKAGRTQVIRSVDEMRSVAVQLRAQGEVVGLVPTMGCLHRGHLSLIESAREQAGKVVVSIFVNPIQFGPNEDYERYPHDFDHDLAVCEEAGVDCIFHPSADDLYPEGYSTYITEEKYSKPLCGISRPAHFRGVLTVVGKLFNIVRPDFAVFGQKDAQQAAVIRKMVADLHFGVEIVIRPTLREEDGLAMSSRNAYLTSGQREDARVIYEALQKAEEMVRSGTVNTDRVEAEVSNRLQSKRRLRVIYVEIVDPDTMAPLREITPGKSLLAVAVWVDEVRLIDNILL